MVGLFGKPVGCVWFTAVTLAELAKLAEVAELAELATALITWVAEALTLLLEAEEETGDEVAAARTYRKSSPVSTHVARLDIRGETHRRDGIEGRLRLKAFIV